jgi:hypothetical protein
VYFSFICFVHSFELAARLVPPPPPTPTRILATNYSLHMHHYSSLNPFRHYSNLLLKFAVHFRWLYNFATVLSSSLRSLTASAIILAVIQPLRHISKALRYDGFYSLSGDKPQGSLWEMKTACNGDRNWIQEDITERTKFRECLLPHISQYCVFPYVI